MCTAPSIPKDNSAQIALQQQQQREAAIKQGQGVIDKDFAGFNPDFYNKYTSAYENNYNPQVDEQYGLARQKETYNLARNGTLDSTPGMTANDQLVEGYQNQRRAIASNALQATNTLKGNVANQKSQLYALNASAADPTLAGEQAVAEAGALQTTPSYSPLGDLFGSLVNSTNSFLTGKYNAMQPYGYGYGGSPYGFSPGGSLPSSNGAGAVIGG
jgi:hypothetical protein